MATPLGGAENIAANQYVYGKLTAAGLDVYPGIAGRGAALPYVTYQLFPRPDGGDTTALGGIRVLARLRYLIKVQADSLGAAAPLLRSIDAALSGTEGAAAPYYVSNVRRADVYEQPTLEGDTLYFEAGGYYDLDVSAGL